MATGKSHYARPSYRFLSSDSTLEVASSPFELNESDFYNSNSDDSAEFTRKPATTVLGSRKCKQQTNRSDSGGGTPASLPVNIPDWSKILKDEYRDNRRAAELDSDDDDVYGEDSVRIPPHEFLARQMSRTGIVSFSVHEGVGRTLKGGNLTGVRNAIWEKTGNNKEEEMARVNSYYARPSYRFLSSNSTLEVASSPLELDQSDFYDSNSDNPAEFTHKPATTVSGSRKCKKQTNRSDSGGGTPASLPVNIPDWSKILKDEYRDNRRAAALDSDDDDVYGEDSVRIPPHEFLARQMSRTGIVSFSVHEGVGRTLKGGDLTGVRNAIWKNTGNNKKEEMATGKSYYTRPSYRFLSSNSTLEVASSSFELYESDFYNSNSDNLAEFTRKSVTTVLGSQSVRSRRITPIRAAGLPRRYRSTYLTGRRF